MYYVSRFLSFICKNRLRCLCVTEMYAIFFFLDSQIAYCAMKMNVYNAMAVRVNISSLVKQMKSQLCLEFTFNKMSKPE